MKRRNKLFLGSKALLPLSLLILTLSCAHEIQPRGLFAEKGEKFTLQSGKVEVELLYEKDHESITGPVRNSVSRASIKAGTVIPAHTHENTDEILYFLKGAGIFTVGKESFNVKDHSLIVIPRRVKHSYKNESKIDVKIIQFYNPAGIGQRFKNRDK